MPVAMIATPVASEPIKILSAQTEPSLLVTAQNPRPYNKWSSWIRGCLHNFVLALGMVLITLGLTALICLFFIIKKGSKEDKLTAVEAKETLSIALDSWILKESSTDFQKAHSDIRFTTTWDLVNELGSYTITASSQKSPSDTHIATVLNLTDKFNGKRTHQNVVYKVTKIDGKYRILEERN